MKYLRIFTQTDDSSFAVFAEYGINRKYTAKLTSDTDVELKVIIPIPPDQLISQAGYHAVQGARLSDVEEEFYFEAPEGRRFSVNQDEHKKATYYPNDLFPQWVYFKFELEKERKEFEVATDVDFQANLFALQEKVNTVHSNKT